MISPHSFFRITLGDYALAVAILAVSFGAMTPASRTLPLKHRMARVYEQGRLIEQVDLSRNGCAEIARHRMQVEVKDGRIRVDRSDCPNGICKKAGWIGSPGQAIMCVPNRILIEIAGEREADYDAVSF